MSEIKPMNLSGVSHNPLRGDAASGQNSIADKMRANAQLRMVEQMNKYKVQQMKRAEADYQLGKKTENYVFSNYPSGSKSTWDAGMDGLKFGEGSRAAQLAKWKENVGGNMQGFEAYYQAGKKAEMDGIKKSLIRDPLKFSEDGWKKHVSKTIASWDPQMRESFMNSLDTETRGLLMQYYDPESQISWGEWADRKIDDNFGWDDNPGKSALAVAGATALGVGGLYAGYKALRRGKLPGGGKGGSGGIMDQAKRLTGKGDQKLLPGGNQKLLPAFSRDLDGSKMSKGEIAKMMNAGEITGAQAKVLGKGGKINLGNPRKQMMNIINEGIPENAVKDIPKYLKQAQLDGKLTQSSADQLQGIINTLQKQGKVINSKNISDSIMRLGPRGGALVAQIDKGVDLGPIKGLGFMKSLGLGIGLYQGTSMMAENMAEMMGASENNAEVYGDVAGIATAGVGVPAAPHVLAKLKDVYSKKGGAYIIKKLGSKIGMKAAARIVGKGFLSGLAGPGAGVIAPMLLAADAYMIYDALQDIE